MRDEEFYGAKFLIVDDEPSNVRLLERQLGKWGLTNLQSTNDSREVMSLCATFAPDIILLDLMMPHLNGLEVMEQLRPWMERERYLPILILSADITPQAKQKGLAAGARDFLNKPFESAELFLRIRNLLETRFLYCHQQNQTAIAENMVRERTLELDESQIEILERLAQAAEFRDDDTGQHTQRVGYLAGLLAQRMGIDKSTVDLLRKTAPLHDVGKIGISDLILLKPGKLSPEEFEVMKSHTTIGASLLKGGRSKLVQMAQAIALSHHERWSGGGYPRGLVAGQIPIEGRIVAVVDVFDALTHERPYKQAWPVERAIEEIRSQSGRQFDPEVVAAFECVPDLEDYV